MPGCGLTQAPAPSNQNIPRQLGFSGNAQTRGLDIDFIIFKFKKLRWTYIYLGLANK
jgi:hypothetical protein